MYLRYFGIIAITVQCFAADQDLPTSKHNIGFQTWILGALTPYALYQDWKFQTHMQRDVAVDTEIINEGGKCGAEFVYSKKQRMIARDRQEAITLGLFNFAKFVLRPSWPCTLRPIIDPLATVESALLPITLYIATKPSIDTIAASHLSNQIRSSLAVFCAFTLSHYVIATGASSQRIFFSSLMHYLSSYGHNLCRDTVYVKQLTASLDYASKIMPLTQMAISTLYPQPSMLTIHPVMKMGGINKYAEFMHGMVPVGVLAGVDLIFNAVAVTPVGTAIGSVVDAGVERAIQPWPRHMRRPFRRISKDLKQYSLEVAKITTTIAILVAMESSGLKFA